MLVATRLSHFSAVYNQGRCAARRHGLCVHIQQLPVERCRFVMRRKRSEPVRKALADGVIPRPSEGTQC